MALRILDDDVFNDWVLRPFAAEIWLADGPSVSVAGFDYPTRMAIVRLTGGGLFVWSPIPLSDALRDAVDALGEVRHLVAPNSLHHLSLAEWHRTYPQAALHAPPGLKKRRSDLNFTRDLTDAAAAEWAGEIDQVVIGGNFITSEVVFFHCRSGTVLFADLIQHFDPQWFHGWRAIAARLDLMTAPEPEVPRKFRHAFYDRRAARAALRRILAWPAEHVVMAHAPPVESGGQAFIARAFRWLL